jgi:hypothetical protein
MAWMKTREPGQRIRNFDPEKGLELLSRGGAPGYSEFRIVRMDNHDGVVMDFGASREKRPLAKAEKLEYPHAQECVFFRLDGLQRRRLLLSGYSLEESKSIVRDAILTRQIGMFSPEALKKYKLDVVFDF